MVQYIDVIFSYFGKELFGRHGGSKTRHALVVATIEAIKDSTAFDISSSFSGILELSSGIGEETCDCFHFYYCLFNNYYYKT